MVVNVNQISGLVKIEENILELLKEFDFSFKEDTNNLVTDYIKMFLAKEKRIISELPTNDKEFNDSVISNLGSIVAENISDSDNSEYVFSRLLGFFNSCNLKIESSYASVFDGDVDLMDGSQEADYNIKLNDYYKNLQVKYIKGLEDLKDLGIYDNILSDIQRYNLFIESDVFDRFVNSDFDVDKMEYFEDNYFQRKYKYDDEEFSNFKKTVIYYKLFTMISLMFSNADDTMFYLDAELNFKQFIGELSYDYLTSFIDMLDGFLNEYFENSDKDIHDFKDKISLIKKCLVDELARKQFNKDFEFSPEVYDKLFNFVFLEKKILSVIDNMDFDVSDLDVIKKLNSLLDIESEMISDLNNLSVIDLSQFFNYELASVLDDDAKLCGLISNRAFSLLSAFSSLLKSPGQSVDSFKIIDRNYIISSLKSFYNLIDGMEASDIKDAFYGVYKEQFFMYPFLTELLVNMGGNHLMMEPFSLELSTELSGIDEIEYSYDLDNQLYDEALNLVNDLSMFDDSLQEVDAAYLHLKLLQFNYICQSLDVDSLDNLSDFLLESYNDAYVYDILLSITEVNLRGFEYDVSISISSDGTDIKILALGGV